MRHPYRMRRVVGWFAYHPFPKDKNYGAMSWPKDVLECGHMIKMPTLDSRANAVKAFGEMMCGPGKRRCYRCADGRPIKPDDWRGSRYACPA